MILYLTIIFISMALIAVLNFLFGANDSFWFIALWVVLATLIEIAIDSVMATVGRWMIPKKCVGVDKKKFGASKKEARFYEKIGIKKWKDKTLDLGAFTGFRKKTLGDATDNNYVERFIVEANYGIIVHILCIVLGALVVLACPKGLKLSIGIPVAVINALLNEMSLMILRYNLPKLHVLYKYNQKKQKQNQQAA